MFRTALNPFYLGAILVFLKLKPTILDKGTTTTDALYFYVFFLLRARYQNWYTQYYRVNLKIDF